MNDSRLLCCRSFTPASRQSASHVISMQPKLHAREHFLSPVGVITILILLGYFGLSGRSPTMHLDFNLARTYIAL